MSIGFGQAGFTILEVRVRDPVATSAVGVTAGQLEKSNPNRQKILIHSTDTNTGIIYIGFNGRVSATVYDEVIPVGEDLILSDKREIWAISGTAAQAVSIKEYIFQAGVPLQCPYMKVPQVSESPSIL